MKYEDVKTCGKCGFAEDRDLLSGVMIPCGYRFCLAKDRYMRSKSLSCWVYFEVVEE